MRRQKFFHGSWKIFSNAKAKWALRGKTPQKSKNFQIFKNIVFRHKNVRRNQIWYWKKSSGILNSFKKIILKGSKLQILVFKNFMRCFSQHNVFWHIAKDFSANISANNLKFSAFIHLSKYYAMSEVDFLFR